mgnify:CR=1 FL=1
MDNPQRGRSNNSAVIVRDETTPEEFGKIMESVKQFGEPGFVFVESKEHTTNPCVEIGMYPQINKKSGWQGCNLTEINGGKCNTEEDFYKACRAASILGTLQAGYTDFKFLTDTSKLIFDREALLGVSITEWVGYAAMVLLLISFMMKDVRKLRIINSFACFPNASLFVYPNIRSAE